MLIPTYTPSQARWDEYKRFHQKHTNFLVQFENGETIITRSTFDPVLRRKIHGTDLRIVGTTDEDCPQFKLDPKAPDVAATRDTLRAAGYDWDYTKPIPKAWLDVGGMQTLLIDETTKRTVALSCVSTHAHEAWRHVPAQFSYGNSSRWSVHSAAAYIPGEGRDAIAAKVQLKITYKPGSEERRQTGELWRACTAWAELGNWNYNALAPHWWSTEAYTRRHVYHRAFELGSAGVPDLSDLRPEQIFQIAKFGFVKRHVNLMVDHVVAGS